MKIVEAISDSNIGGAGILLLTRLAKSDKKRFSYHVLIPKGSALKERLKALEGVTVWEIAGGSDHSFSLRALWRTASLLRYLEPDLINCHGSLSARLAAWLCRVPCRVCTRHCAYEPKRWQTVFPWKYCIGFVQGRLSTQMIAVADAAKKNLTDMGADAARVRVIINGVRGLRRIGADEAQAVRIAYGIPEGAVVIGICARLEPCKDHDTFLRAAAILSRRSEQYFFLVIGDGSLLNALRERGKALGIASRVCFTGFVSDVAPLFHLLYVNVNCSVGTETSSLALSEGMSLGIPCVVSDYGGNPYMVKDGENGLVYPQKNAERLAEAIERLCRDEGLYRRLSEGAERRFREELNDEKMTKETEQLYEELFRQVRCRARGLRSRNRSEEPPRRRSW